MTPHSTPIVAPLTDFDIVIIGAGPTGLAAAVYASREGLKTVVVEKAVVGGLAAITATIDNYPGFAEGVGGLELADHLAAHAKRFGAEIRTGIDVTGLSVEADGTVAVATAGAPMTARSVLVATGSTYKHLGIPGEAEHIGRGVHFCATCDGPVYRGRELVVVGGGNSALQETVFLAKFASHITMLVRGPQFKGSAVLIDQVTALPNVSVRFDTEATAIVGEQLVEAVTIRNVQTGHADSLTPAGVFIFIGLYANSQPFASVLELDERQFIVTGADFTTRLPGVYAAGDVRSGATWQIASAVGEGVSATLAIRAYLDAQALPTAIAAAKA